MDSYIFTIQGGRLLTLPVLRSPSLAPTAPPKAGGLPPASEGAEGGNGAARGREGNSKWQKEDLFVLRSITTIKIEWHFCYK